MSGAELAYGSKIRQSTDQGVSWAAIKMAKEANPPAVERDYHEITNLDSPAGFKEFMPGLKDAGEIEVPAIYSPAEYDTQLAAQEADDELFYEVEFTGGRKFYFRAFNTVSLDKVEPNQPRTMTIKLKVTGAPRSTLAELQEDVA